METRRESSDHIEMKMSEKNEKDPNFDKDRIHTQNPSRRSLARTRQTRHWHRAHCGQAG